MEYRLFGRTGVRVSALGLGCGGFGGVGSLPELFGKGEDERAAFAVMDRAFELGINYFDTADSYGGGRSEEMVGRWLADRRLRDRVFLSTKVFNRVGPDVNQAGLSRRHLMLQVEASLLRLGTEWLDLYVCHEVDHDTALDETLRALDDLVRSGKVRYVGASNIEAWRVVKALWLSDRLGAARFESVQNEYNLLHRGAEAEVLPLAADQKLAVTPFSPLAGGLLTGKYRLDSAPPSGSRMTLRPEPYAGLWNQPTFRAIGALADAAAERGVSSGALALAWVVSHPQVTAALVGPRSPDQLAVAEDALGITLSPSERDGLARRLDEARQV